MAVVLQWNRLMISNGTLQRSGTCWLFKSAFLTANDQSLPWQFVNLNEPIRVCQSFGSLVVG